MCKFESIENPQGGGKDPKGQYVLDGRGDKHYVAEGQYIN